MTTKTDKFNYCLLIIIFCKLEQNPKCNGNNAVHKPRSQVQKLQTAKRPVHTNSNYGKRFVRVCVVLRSSGK